MIDTFEDKDFQKDFKRRVKLEIDSCRKLGSVNTLLGLQVALDIFKACIKKRDEKRFARLVS